jgi:phosphopantetheine binding protein
VGWQKVLEPWGGGMADLPTYAFQRQRYWLDTDERLIEAATARTAEVSWPEKLADLPATQREERLLEWVRAEIAAVLGLAGAPAVLPDTLLKDLGMKSPVAVELGSRLGRRMGRQLPVTFVYNYPTARGMARALLAGMAPPGPTPVREERAASPSPAPEDPSALSDDELFHSIDALVNEDGPTPRQEKR